MDFSSASRGAAVSQKETFILDRELYIRGCLFLRWFVLTGFAQWHIEALLCICVQQVNGRQKTLTLSEGTPRSFDTLGIPTGLSAQRPPIPAIDIEGE